MNESFGLLILWFSSPFSWALDSLTSIQDYSKEKKNYFEEIIKISVKKKQLLLQDRNKGKTISLMRKDRCSSLLFWVRRQGMDVLSKWKGIQLILERNFIFQKTGSKLNMKYPYQWDHRFIWIVLRTPNRAVRRLNVIWVVVGSTKSSFWFQKWIL